MFGRIIFSLIFLSVTPLSECCFTILAIVPFSLRFFHLLSFTSAHPPPGSSLPRSSIFQRPVSARVPKLNSLRGHTGAADNGAPLLYLRGSEFRFSHRATKGEVRVKMRNGAKLIKRNFFEFFFGFGFCVEVQNKVELEIGFGKSRSKRWRVVRRSFDLIRFAAGQDNRRTLGASWGHW